MTECFLVGFYYLDVTGFCFVQEKGKYAVSLKGLFHEMNRNLLGLKGIRPLVT